MVVALVLVKDNADDDDNQDIQSPTETIIAYYDDNHGACDRGIVLPSCFACGVTYLSVTQKKHYRPSYQNTLPYQKNHCHHCTSIPALIQLWSFLPCQIPANPFLPSSLALPPLLSLPPLFRLPLFHLLKRIGYRRFSTYRKDTMGFWDSLLAPTFYIRSWFREHCYRLICMQHATSYQERKKLY